MSNQDQTPVSRMPELLAPAGSMEAFRGAVKAGADAVYMAGKSFGARAYAENFTTDDLIGCFSYAHFYGRKVYLTVNTLVKETEFGDLEGFLEPLVSGGLDGVIIQDLGVVRYLRRRFPDLALHASTQMSVTGPEGVKLLRDHGISRVVPARELSLSEIRRIKEETGMELECFIHGAMCYSYSGQCLMSSLYGGRSGNRGRCAQPCRLNYTCPGLSKSVKNEEYPFSLKDLCTAEFLPELVAAGIDSFKIEGRMKAPEYVAGVTSIYRKVIDRIAAGETEHFLYPEESGILRKLYVRGDLSGGYYHQRNGRNLVTFTKPGYNGSEDALLEKIRSEYLEPAFTAYAPSVPLTAEASFVTGAEAVLTLRTADGAHAVTVTGKTVEPAKNQPISEENIRKQVLRLGGTFFTLQEEDLKITVSGDAFYSLKEIGELRRAAVQALTEQMTEQMPETGDSSDRADGVKPSADSGMPSGSVKPFTEKLSVLVSDVSQLRAALESAPDLVYVEEELLLSETETVLALLKKADCRIHLALARIRRDHGKRSVQDFYEELLHLLKEGIFDGILVRNLDDLSFFERNLPDTLITTDADLYVWNREAGDFLKGYADRLTLPLELTGKETKHLLTALSAAGSSENGSTADTGRSAHSFERVVYGRPALMVTAGCVRKTYGQPCGTKPAFLTMQDRKEITFPVKTNCIHCYNQIYNFLPLSLHNELRTGLQKAGELPYTCRLEFTTERAEEVSRILSFYRELLAGIPSEAQKYLPPAEYTTGWAGRKTE